MIILFANYNISFLQKFVFFHFWQFRPIFVCRQQGIFLSIIILIQNCFIESCFTTSVSLYCVTIKIYLFLKLPMLPFWMKLCLIQTLSGKLTFNQKRTLKFIAANFNIFYFIVMHRQMYFFNNFFMFVQK